MLQQIPHDASNYRHNANQFYVLFLVTTEGDYTSFIPIALSI